MAGKSAPAGSDDWNDCVICAAGKFAAAGDVLGCQTCAVGKYVDGVNLFVNGCSLRVPLESSPYTSNHDIPQRYDQRLDMPGKYAAQGSAMCTDCAAGMYKAFLVPSFDVRQGPVRTRVITIYIPSVRQDGTRWFRCRRRLCRMCRW
jgi:hypothetical protein